MKRKPGRPRKYPKPEEQQEAQPTANGDLQEVKEEPEVKQEEQQAPAKRPRGRPRKVAPSAEPADPPPPKRPRGRPPGAPRLPRTPGPVCVASTAARDPQPGLLHAAHPAAAGSGKQHQQQQKAQEAAGAQVRAAPPQLWKQPAWCSGVFAAPSTQSRTLSRAALVAAAHPPSCCPARPLQANGAASGAAAAVPAPSRNRRKKATPTKAE